MQSSIQELFFGKISYLYRICILKKLVKILQGIPVLLIVVRLLPPYFVLRYANKVLAGMDGYTGHVSDLAIALYRGAYQIDSVNIRKINGIIEEPFLGIPKMDLPVEWKSIWKRKLV